MIIQTRGLGILPWIVTGEMQIFQNCSKYALLCGLEFLTVPPYEQMENT